jgi:hypothetical protein
VEACGGGREWEGIGKRRGCVSRLVFVDGVVAGDAFKAYEEIVANARSEHAVYIDREENSVFKSQNEWNAIDKKVKPNPIPRD